MTSTHSVTHPLTETASEALHSGMQAIGEWSGRAVTYVQNLPTYLHHHPPVGLGVCMIANLFFFIAMNHFANWINESLKREELSDSQKKFKDILLNEVVVGGSVFTVNVLFSKAVYPISNYAIAGATFGAIFVRRLLSYYSEERTTLPQNTLTQSTTYAKSSPPITTSETPGNVNEIVKETSKTLPQNSPNNTRVPPTTNVYPALTNQACTPPQLVQNVTDSTVPEKEEILPAELMIISQSNNTSKEEADTLQKEIDKAKKTLETLQNVNIVATKKPNSDPIVSQKPAASEKV